MNRRCVLVQNTNVDIGAVRRRNGDVRRNIEREMTTVWASQLLAWSCMM